MSVNGQYGQGLFLSLSEGGFGASSKLITLFPPKKLLGDFIFLICFLNKLTKLLFSASLVCWLLEIKSFCIANSLRIISLELLDRISERSETLPL